MAVQDYVSSNTLFRLNKLMKRFREIDDDPLAIGREERQELAFMLASTLTDFVEFAYICFKWHGFEMSPMQADIARYMQNSGNLVMVTAGRNEAKTTIACFYAIWRMIHNHRIRIMIVSANEEQTLEIGNLIIGMIKMWSLLCIYRPDSGKGDRASQSALDIHWHLKPVDKSPTIRCVSIGGQLPSKRADLLISDDIENTKNSLTQDMRAKLIAASQEFSAICGNGKILYLGTPQNMDSVYKTLPARGFEVRIWCARIPSEVQERNMGDMLAPYIKDMIANGAKREGFGLGGDLGEATDPQMLNETWLCNKEADYGMEGFQLQYMLDTTFSDAKRRKLDVSDLIFYRGDYNSVPASFTWTGDSRFVYKNAHGGLRDVTLQLPISIGKDVVPFKHKLMAVDPSGQGGDELAFTITGAASSYIHILAVGGLQGGMSTANIDTIIDRCLEYGVNDILIESNFGGGTCSMLFINRLAERGIGGIGVRDKYNSTQKEARIIDTLAPIMSRHRLVVHTDVLDQDVESCMPYPQAKRWKYSLFVQMHTINYTRKCIDKYDRVDCLALGISDLLAHLAEDENKVVERRKQEEFQTFLKDPTGSNKYVIGRSRDKFQRMSTLNRRKGKRR